MNMTASWKTNIKKQNKVNKENNFQRLKRLADEKEMDVEHFIERYINKLHRICLTNDAALFYGSVINEYMQSRIYDI